MQLAKRRKLLIFISFNSYSKKYICSQQKEEKKKKTQKSIFIQTIYYSSFATLALKYISDILNNTYAVSKMKKNIHFYFI